jgi:electron transfer flavoprotein alpha subunit
MWITNGSIATQFSLFARSAEGVTGFMVDRFAEGMTVGADERKMGQRGSPTNEISLDGVRVPRECVIGYEGHGQVNALETLNAGRCGLAVVAGALARKAIDEARRTLPPSAERDRLLGEAAAIQFGSESLAYYLIGLFDRPHESVRMESAIAKYVCSEDVHEVLSLAEQALGPAGQTERFVVEKARRDARILNIYEGTNEVQRFLVLKDLAALAAEWPELPSALAERPDDGRGRTLAAWKNRLRSRVAAAVELLGDAAWSDAMLQPALFPLSELAGEVLRLECTWYRMEWLDRMRARLGDDYVRPLLAAGTRSAGRTMKKLEHLDAVAERAWKDILSGRGTPEVRAADAALDRPAHERPPTRTAAVPPAGLRRMLCIFRPVADLSPSPRLAEGALRELVWRIDPSDEAAFGLGRQFRASGTGVTIDVMMAGLAIHEELLRHAGAGADRLVRIGTGIDDVLSIGRAVQELEAKDRYDLILLGSRTAAGDRTLGRLLSGYLGRPCIANDDADPGTAPLPAVIVCSPGTRFSPADAARLVRSAVQQVEVISPAPAPRQAPDSFAVAGGAAVSAPTAATPAEAAALLRSFASAVQASRAEAWKEEVRNGTLSKARAIWTLLDGAGPSAERAALRAARTAADAFGLRSHCLIASRREGWPQLIGRARADGADAVFCVDTGKDSLSDEGRRAMLRLLGKDAGAAMFLAGPAWDASLGGRAGSLLASSERPVRLLSGVISMEKDSDGGLVLGMPCYEGKLVRRTRFDGGDLFATFAAEADLPATPARKEFRASEIALTLSPDWLAPVAAAGPPSLSEAEVIIDIGYGIRDRQGMELVLELKQKLEALGLASMLGATRKVTQDLKLQPLETQIGQTGVAVNPKLVIALGISGAPQHVDWIGARAEILCFNKDAEAPLMKLNQTRPAPRVHPIPGDLFVTVRELIGKLG